MKVYIAGPISKGDRQANYDQAVAACYELIRAGIAVYCPHLFMMTHIDNVPREETDPEHLKKLMINDFEWIKVCDVMLRLPGESVGADEEVAYAESLGIPIFNSTAEVVRAIH